MPPAQNPGQAQGQRPDIEPEIIKHVREFNYYLPVDGPQAGTPEGDTKIKEMRNSYAMALNKQHKAKSRISMLDNMIQQRQKSGQEIQPELLANKEQMQKEYNSAKSFVDSFREKQKANKREHDDRRAKQQQQQNQNQPTQQTGFTQQQQQPTPQQRQNSQPNIKTEPAIKVEGALSQPPPAQQFGNMSGAPQQSQQQQPPSQQQQQQQQGGLPQGQANMPQQPMRQPVPHQQLNQTPNQHPQFAQPGQPQSLQQPPRPQINPHQANGMPHPQNNSPHPQSATSAGGRPVPLSHQDAVSAAQRSYSNADGTRTTTPMQGQPGQGNFHTPGSREREQLNNPKMPIPRNLNVSAPSPINMGPARPTISGPSNGAPGPMGQPVISRIPPFQLEGDSDRVLSKRKLDELVRQVTGGSDEALTPEVEEGSCTHALKFHQDLTLAGCSPDGRRLRGHGNQQRLQACKASRISATGYS